MEAFGMKIVHSHFLSGFHIKGLPWTDSLVPAFPPRRVQVPQEYWSQVSQVQRSLPYNLPARSFPPGSKGTQAAVYTSPGDYLARWRLATLVTPDNKDKVQPSENIGEPWDPAAKLKITPGASKGTLKSPPSKISSF